MRKSHQITDFKVLGMTRPGIEPRPPDCEADTVTARPRSRFSIRRINTLLVMIMMKMVVFVIHILIDVVVVVVAVLNEDSYSD